MEEEKKYFWLRLKRDFFKRHDVRILEAMPNGKEYVMFYLKMLTESIDHEGALRFSDTTPYSTEMLATIANTSPEIAEGAIKALISLEMVESQEDGTLKMIGIENMIGFETKWAEKKRKYRQQKDKERTEEGQSEDITRTKKDNVRQEKEKEIEIDIKKESIKKEPDKSGTPAPKHQYGEFGHVMLKDSEKEKLEKELGSDMARECIRFLDEYIEMKGYKAKSHYMCIKKWVVDAVNERKPADKLVHNQYAKREIDFESLEADLLKKRR